MTSLHNATMGSQEKLYGRRDQQVKRLDLRAKFSKDS